MPKHDSCAPASKVFFVFTAYIWHSRLSCTAEDIQDEFFGSYIPLWRDKIAADASQRYVYVISSKKNIKYCLRSAYCLHPEAIYLAFSGFSRFAVKFLISEEANIKCLHAPFSCLTYKCATRSNLWIRVCITFSSVLYNRFFMPTFQELISWFGNLTKN